MTTADRTRTSINGSLDTLIIVSRSNAFAADRQAWNLAQFYHLLPKTIKSKHSRNMSQHSVRYPKMAIAASPAIYDDFHFRLPKAIFCRLISQLFRDLVHLWPCSRVITWQKKRAKLSREFDSLSTSTARLLSPKTQFSLLSFRASKKCLQKREKFSKRRWLRCLDCDRARTEAKFCAHLISNFQLRHSTLRTCMREVHVTRRLLGSH